MGSLSGRKMLGNLSHVVKVVFFVVRFVYWSCSFLTEFRFRLQTLWGFGSCYGKWTVVTVWFLFVPIRSIGERVLLNPPITWIGSPLRGWPGIQIKAGLWNQGVYSPFCDTRESPPLYGVLVFGKPFLLYPRSGHLTTALLVRRPLHERNPTTIKGPPDFHSWQVY